MTNKKFIRIFLLLYVVFIASQAWAEDYRFEDGTIRLQPLQDGNDSVFLITKSNKVIDIFKFDRGWNYFEGDIGNMPKESKYFFYWAITIDEETGRGMNRCGVIDVRNGCIVEETGGGGCPTNYKDLKNTGNNGKRQTIRAYYEDRKTSVGYGNTPYFYLGGEFGLDNTLRCDPITNSNYDYYAKTLNLLKANLHAPNAHRAMKLLQSALKNKEVFLRKTEQYERK